MKVTRTELAEALNKALKRVIRETEEPEDFSEFGIGPMNREGSREQDMDDIFSNAEDKFNQQTTIAPNHGRHFSAYNPSLKGWNAMCAMDPTNTYARNAGTYNAAAPYKQEDLPDDFLQQISESKIRKAVKKSLNKVLR